MATARVSFGNSLLFSRPPHHSRCVQPQQTPCVTLPRTSRVNSFRKRFGRLFDTQSSLLATSMQPTLRRKAPTPCLSCPHTSFTPVAVEHHMIIILRTSCPLCLKQPEKVLMTSSHKNDHSTCPSSSIRLSASDKCKYPHPLFYYNLPSYG